MAKEIDRTRSLQQLEQHDWGEPTFDSHLVQTCHRLRRKPLIELTVEDLRIMIGQNIGLPYLIPVALEQLEVDPLTKGDLFAGDLLGVVLSSDAAFWTARPDLADQIRKIVGRVRATLSGLDEIAQQTVRRVLANGNPELT